MNNLLLGTRRLYAGFVHGCCQLQSVFLLVVRLYWGWQFVQNGWAKLHNLANVTEYFSSLGLPMPHVTAIFVSSTELIGGTLLALGLFSRFIGLVLTIDMTVAYIVGDRESFLAFFSNPGKFYNADPYTFLFASLLILIFGPGKFSLDTLFERLWEKHGAKQAGSSGD